MSAAADLSSDASFPLRKHQDVSRGRQGRQASTTSRRGTPATDTSRSRGLTDGLDRLLVNNTVVPDSPSYALRIFRSNTISVHQDGPPQQQPALILP